MGPKLAPSLKAHCGVLSKKMKHIFLAESDFASSGHAFALALNSVGEDARTFVRRKQQYAYPEQGELLPKSIEEIEEIIHWADWVWIIQTDLPVNLGGGCYANVQQNDARDSWMELISKKHVAVLHGGSLYRKHREFYFNLWKDVADISICYSADLMGSFVNEHLVVPPVNLKWFSYKPRDLGPVRIGHFPSRPTDKGSEWIVPMMNRIKGAKAYTSVKNPWDQYGVERAYWGTQLDRMSACDAVIDQVKPELDGATFGEWVSIATETAALGRIAIANSLNPGPYLRTYGEMPGIHICNTPEALESELTRLAGLGAEGLVEEQEESRAWVERNHALEPTGKILQGLIS
jgi:hypothetical protein